jgi:hypothetical protein
LQRLKARFQSYARLERDRIVLISKTMLGRGHQNLRSDLDAYRLMKRLSAFQIAFSILAVLLVVMLQEGIYLGFFLLTSATLVKIVIMFFSWTQIGLLYTHYRCRVRISSSSGLLSPSASLYRANLLPSYVAELAVFCVFPYPWLTFGSAQEYRLGLFVFARLYLFVRFFYLRSYFTSSTGRFVSAFTRISIPMNFVIRDFLAEHPYVVLVFGFTPVFFIFSYCLFVIERDDNPLLNTYSNAMWLTVISMFTIGYGDRTPKSVDGRALMIVGAFFGVLVAALIVSVMYDEMQLSKLERNLVKFLRHQQLRTRVRMEAASCVQHAYRIKVISGQATAHQQRKSTGAAARARAMMGADLMMAQKDALALSTEQRKLFLAMNSFRTARRQFALEKAEEEAEAVAIKSLQQDILLLKQTMKVLEEWDDSQLGLDRSWNDDEDDGEDAELVEQRILAFKAELESRFESAERRVAQLKELLVEQAER